MVTVLVFVSLAALFALCLPNLLRPMRTGPPQDPPPGPPRDTAGHPESMTAELEPGDEEYLACLADELWPDDEYQELEHTTDGEEESGGSGMLL